MQGLHWSKSRLGQAVRLLKWRFEEEVAFYLMVSDLTKHSFYCGLVVLIFSSDTVTVSLSLWDQP